METRLKWSHGIVKGVVERGMEGKRGRAWKGLAMVRIWFTLRL